MELAELETVVGRERAQVLLDPLRLRILERAREPISASRLADDIGMARQRVNYHVRALAKNRFLRKAGTRKRRGLTEQRYQATARSYVLAPDLLDAMAADFERIEDPLSAAYLMALASRVHGELGSVMSQAARQKKRVATLSMQAEVRFRDPEQRAAFAAELRSAVTDVVRRHSDPFTCPDGTDAPGRPFRLVVGCYPIPKEDAT